MKQRSGGIFALIGLAAAFFILRKFVPSLAKLFLLLGGVAALGVAVLVVVVLFFAFAKPKKTAEQQAAENTAAVLQKGRSMLMDLRRLSMKVKDNEIRKTAEAICAGIDKILRTLKEQPDDIGRVDRFFHYYLPTLQSVLTKYSRLEACGIPADDTVEKTRSCLKDMEKAMEKQYLNLFEDDKLDLSVEMTVLTQICKRDGLLADDYQIPEVAESPAAEESEGIMLTL
ncbi:MAG: 5-bromo-4-chloroindolyl phosphate hydrolysis family protein [Oscillospiraceae bacterium]|nr:5-bromo-4-chloroindolyl phosphate hydrolysis family protein [Oscillospiraceae bacterium]